MADSYRDIANILSEVLADDRVSDVRDFERQELVRRLKASVSSASLNL